MNEIILSFKPEFFKALLTGKKHFEYRSRIPEKETVAYLYLSSPAKMIVGKMILGQRNNIQNFLENSDLENSSRPYLENHLQEGAKYFSPIYSLSLLDSPISLKQAKELSPRFNASQGYSYVTNIKNCIIFLKTLYFQHLRLIHLMFWTY